MGINNWIFSKNPFNSKTKTYDVHHVDQVDRGRKVHFFETCLRYAQKNVYTLIILTVSAFELLVCQFLMKTFFVSFHRDFKQLYDFWRIYLRKSIFLFYSLKTNGVVNEKSGWPDRDGKLVPLQFPLVSFIISIIRFRIAACFLRLFLIFSLLDWRTEDIYLACMATIAVFSGSVDGWNISSQKTAEADR